MTLGVLCLEDADRARQLARQGFGWFYRQLLQQTLPVLESLHTGGVSRVLCAVGAGVLPTDIVRESLHCLADSVLPHFAQPT